MLIIVSVHDLYFALILDDLTEKIDKRSVLGQIAGKGKTFALGSVQTDFEKLVSVTGPRKMILLFTEIILRMVVVAFGI